MKHLDRRNVVKVGGVGLGGLILGGVGGWIARGLFDDEPVEQRVLYHPTRPSNSWSIPFQDKVDPHISEWSSIDVNDVVAGIIKGDVNYRVDSYTNRGGIDAIVSNNRKFFVAKMVRTTRNKNYNVSDIRKKLVNSDGDSGIDKRVVEEVEVSIDRYCLFDVEKQELHLLPDLSSEMEKRGYSGEIDGEVLRVADNGTVVMGLHPSNEEGNYTAGVFARLAAGQTQTYFVDESTPQWDIGRFGISGDGGISNIMDESGVIFYDSDTMNIVDHGLVKGVSGNNKVVIFRRGNYDPNSAFGRADYYIYDPDKLDYKNESRPFSNAGNAPTPHDFLLSSNGLNYMSISGPENNLNIQVKTRVGDNYHRSMNREYPRTLTVDERDRLSIDDSGNVDVKEGKTYPFILRLPRQPPAPLPR